MGRVRVGAVRRAAKMASAMLALIYLAAVVAPLVLMVAVVGLQAGRWAARRRQPTEPPAQRFQMMNM